MALMAVWHVQVPGYWPLRGGDQASTWPMRTLQGTGAFLLQETGSEIQ